MCYRDNVPTLELESVHVACLCGDNGHGKTALLDAMTWALWGWARGRDRHYEELVHQGRQDMSVELEFMAVFDDENLEDRLAYLGEEAGAAPSSVEASAMTLRLLRHYTSSVQHQKYLGLDVVTVQVSGSR